MYPYTITNDTITVIIDGEPHNVRKGAPGFAAAMAAIAADDMMACRQAVSPGYAIAAASGGEIEYRQNLLFKDNEGVPPELYERFAQTVESGGSVQALLAFWERLKLNPSKRAVDTLYTFLTHKNISIHEDGCFFAYKGVREDYLDVHSGTFLNTPGAVMRMARNKISDDPRSACAEGFHVGSLGYATNFGKRVVVCRVDPADVVCVPYDSNNEKVRVCAYSVLGNYVGVSLPDHTITTEDLDVEDDFDIEDDEEDEEDEDAFWAEENASDDDSEEYIMDFDALMKIRLDDLREYARDRGVKNVKAVPGGKAGLIKELRARGLMERKRDEFQVLAPKPPKADRNELDKMSMDELRKFAREKLKLVGANKIPGGKSALLNAIKKAL